MFNVRRKREAAEKSASSEIAEFIEGEKWGLTTLVRTRQTSVKKRKADKKKKRDTPLHVKQTKKKRNQLGQENTSFGSR